jgi:hypothetical protein
LVTVCATEALRSNVCASASAGFCRSSSSAVFTASAGLPATIQASPKASRFARFSGSNSRTASSANAAVSNKPNPPVASARSFSAATLVGSLANIASAASRLFAGSFLPPPNNIGVEEKPPSALAMNLFLERNSFNCATRWSRRTGRQPGAVFRICAHASNV